LVGTARGFRRFAYADPGLFRGLPALKRRKFLQSSSSCESWASAGCTEVQGYLFSPAVPSGEVAGLLGVIADMLRRPVEFAVLGPVE
jgi:hypothetical protein